jgi:hypothetical protein
MLVPLLTNKPVACTPRRTVDVMPSALAALDLELPPGLDGTSFVHRGPVETQALREAHLANGRPHGERDAESAVA